MIDIKKQRQDLYKTLVDILGNNNVYYQPPETIKMNYPAIIYGRNKINQIHADNAVYKLDFSYIITYITKDPDDEVITKLASMPKSSFDREYKADGLYHYVYSIFI